ncbi:MAG: LysR family transcriptional regulator [Alphaproteobacteria bacterium]|nr:LysR family transcriptional regulator [Alphaproteobacteria bacterium]
MIGSPADIRYFAEIASTLNMSRAAERLGISQPSLSLAVQRLEQAVGAELLIRGKRGVTLTRAGARLQAQAAELLQSWENLRSEAQASMHEVRGRYTIGCHTSVGLGFLSDVLPALMQAHPELDIQLRHDLSRKVAEDVVSFRADIGVVVNPVQHPDLIVHPLCKDEVTLWTAGRRTAKDVLICDMDLLQTQDLLKKLKKRSLVFKRVMHSGSLEVIADLVAHGVGTGVLPGRVAARAPKPLKRVPKAPVFHDDHCLIYRMENRNVKSIQVLSDAVRAVFKQAR